MSRKEIWYSKLKFRDNPLSIKPAVVNDKLIGQAETVDLVSKVLKKGGMCLLKGVYGVGKTTLLKNIIRRFAGKRKVVYFSCNRLVKKLDLDKLIHERYGRIGKLLKIKSKDMILLLDEADNLSDSDYDNVIKYTKEGFFKATIFVTHDVSGDSLPDKVKKKIGKRIFNLNVISVDNAVSLVRNRIGDLELISDKVIAEIFEFSPTSIRTFLKNCEDVCRHVVDHGHKRATKRNIREALGMYI